MLTDHDFHPDEPTVRVFRTPSAGVLRLDDDVAVSAAVHDGVVLRHYAFAGHWFKVNVTTGLSGHLAETGEGNHRFAVNCDIATPMEREGDSTFGVDIFTDVLVRQDATSYVITNHDEFSEMLGRGVISPAEGRGAERGLRELLDLIEAGRLLRWLGELAPSGPVLPPRAMRCAAARYPDACGRVPAGPGDRAAGPPWQCSPSPASATTSRSPPPSPACTACCSVTGRSPPCGAPAAWPGSWPPPPTSPLVLTLRQGPRRPRTLLRPTA